MQCEVVRKIATGHYKFNRKLTNVGERQRKRDSFALEDAHPASERKKVQFVHGTYVSFWARSANSSAKPLLRPELCERFCQALALATAQKRKQVFPAEMLKARQQSTPRILRGLPRNWFDQKC